MDAWYIVSIVIGLIVAAIILVEISVRRDKGKGGGKVSEGGYVSDIFLKSTTAAAAISVLNPKNLYKSDAQIFLEERKFSSIYLEFTEFVIKKYYETEIVDIFVVDYNGNRLSLKSLPTSRMFRSSLINKIECYSNNYLFGDSIFFYQNDRGWGADNAFLDSDSAWIAHMVQDEAPVFLLFGEYVKRYSEFFYKNNSSIKFLSNYPEKDKSINFCVEVVFCQNNNKFISYKIVQSSIGVDRNGDFYLKPIEIGNFYDSYIIKDGKILSRYYSDPWKYEKDEYGFIKY